MPSAEESQYAVGLLALLRGREWIVIPSDGGDVIRLRPLSGCEEETIGVQRLLEENQLKPATFPDPDLTTAGDFIGKLLRNAARLSLRSGFALSAGLLFGRFRTSSSRSSWRSS